MNCEQKGNAVVAWKTNNKKHLYEDRYRLLSREVPLVRKMDRGEIFAVFDGIGGAPLGMQAAQEMSDGLTAFYREPDKYPCSWEGVEKLLVEANQRVFDWGFMEGTDRPLGGCAGTVAWIWESQLYILHAGDTSGLVIQGDGVRLLTRLHERGGVMYQYFGLGPYAEFDVNGAELEDGDQILLITDGVTKVFHPLEAARVVQGYNDIAVGAAELVRLSRLRGSPDDITVMLVEWEQED